MPPQLMSLTEGPDLLLDKPILLLGRHHECDIQLNSRKISRRHCCIAQVNDYLVVRDLCSTNGVRINGVRVAEGALKAGDELTIGNFQYKVRWNGQPEAAPPPRPPKLMGRPEPGPFEVGEAYLSCEVPVPLAEPVARAGLQRPPAAHPLEGSRSDAPPDAPPSLVFPDNMQLAPLSELFPKNSPPQSPG